MDHVRNLALFPILGKPLVVYLGLLTFAGFLTTATLGVLILKGKRIPLNNHLLLAKISITIAVIHGFMAFSLFV